MANVIGFLEQIGQDAALRNASPGDLAQAMARAGIDPELQAAIAAKDQARIEALLGAATNVCCVLAPEKPDDEDEEPFRDDDDEIVARMPGVASAA